MTALSCGCSDGVKYAFPEIRQTTQKPEINLTTTTKGPTTPTPLDEIFTIVDRKNGEFIWSVAPQDIKKFPVMGSVDFLA